MKIYLQNDWILEEINKNKTMREDEIRTEKWMTNMENKRMIYADVYGDILKESKSQMKVLDIGGGYNVLTKVLAKNSEYTLVDFLAHGGADFLNENKERFNIKWYCGDWYDFRVNEEYDIVIANDIFPDVDQRLEIFLDKYLPCCHELRLVVTFYNTPKFYETKRIDDSEILTFLSWDGEITALKLEKYLDRMIDTSIGDLKDLKREEKSIFWNGRHVAYIMLRGDK